VTWQVVIGVGADAHVVGFVSFGCVSSFIFGSTNASVQKCTFLLGEEAESMLDMLLGWFLAQFSFHGE
jgi:hypothetical protein